MRRIPKELKTLGIGVGWGLVDPWIVKFIKPYCLSTPYNLLSVPFGYFISYLYCREEKYRSKLIGRIKEAFNTILHGSALLGTMDMVSHTIMYKKLAPYVKFRFALKDIMESCVEKYSANPLFYHLYRQITPILDLSTYVGKILEIPIPPFGLPAGYLPLFAFLAITGYKGIKTIWNNSPLRKLKLFFKR